MGYIVVDSTESLDKFLADTSQEFELSLDTETTGLDWSDRPFLVIVGTATAEYILPIEWAKKAAPLWDRQYLVWFFQNAKFDLRMLRHEGIEIAGMPLDTAILSKILKNDIFGAKAYSLAAQAKRMGWEKDTSVDRYIRENKIYETRTYVNGTTERVPRYDKVPLDVMYPYASKDARLTYDLAKHYRTQADEHEERLFFDEARLTKVCFEMEYRGIRIDPVYTEEALAHEKEQVRRARLAFAAHTGAEFVDSSRSLEPHFVKAGEEITYTEKGNASFTDEILENYTSPLAGIVRTIRGHEKLASTYYSNFLRFADSSHRIHPWMWQAGPRTRRFSYSDPNLQNLPKDEESEAQYVARGCFVPEPGKFFVSIDYSQQEYRMMLAYANEQGLIKQVMDGADVHQATADLLGITRKQAKTLNFAILYGAGRDKLATMLGITPHEAQCFKELYFRKLPKVEVLIDRIIRKGRRNGYVTNWRGFKLRADPDFCYALPNHLIQSGGADVIKLAMVECEKAGLFRDSALPVLQVHDQLLFECQDSSRIPAIVYVMEEAWPDKNGMRLKVDVSYSEKSFAERDMKKGLPC